LILVSGLAPPDFPSPCSIIWLSSSTLMYSMSSYPGPSRLLVGRISLAFFSGAPLLRLFPLLPRLKSLTEASLSSGSEREEQDQYRSPSSLFWRGILQSITFTPRICLASGFSGRGCCGPWVFWVSPTGLLTPPRPSTPLVSQPLVFTF
jgi:hypothetical protein